MFAFLARLALAVSLFCAPAYAGNPPVKAGPVGGAVSGLISKLQNVTLQDLQAAKALADAHGNQISSTCWSAWIVFLQAEQQATTGPDGKPIVLPSIHIIYDAQRAMDFIAALQPTSQISVACAPLANVVKMNVINLITAAATGALIGQFPLP